MRLRLGIALATAFILFSSAAPARADIVLSPYVGSLFSGELPDAKITYGATATFMGAGIFGAEFDYAYTPEFVPETSLDPAVKAMSLMGNLIVGIPIGGTVGASVRPYVTGGIGLFRATADVGDFDARIDPSNDFAVNFGGGLMAFFSDHYGIRGDIRYFRTLGDDNPGSGIDFSLGTQDFWRGTVGVAFKF